MYACPNLSELDDARGLSAWSKELENTRGRLSEEAVDVFGHDSLHLARFCVGPPQALSLPRVLICAFPPIL
eukprot:6484600-Pyramimonas_sp.AAC.1